MVREHPNDDESARLDDHVRPASRNRSNQTE
jgi:hypothetical protein